MIASQGKLILDLGAMALKKRPLSPILPSESSKVREACPVSHEPKG
jgi:hypothetical protein